MKVLFATSEAAPFAKTGGLGDVAGSLPAALKEKGVDARVIMPLYRSIPQHFKDEMEYVTHIYIDIGWRKQYCGVKKLEHDGCIFYFVDNEFYFNGDKPYDYIHLDCEKFIFFSKAVLSLLPSLDFRPDVINCNDWQTAAIPVFLDTFLDNPFYRGIKTVMTIHNLKYQGRWDINKIKDFMNIGDYYFTNDKLEYYKDANLLKGGLVYASKISTVSQSYAEEIQTEQYGEGLSGIINARKNDLVGILNGISYKDWNPETDINIFDNYNVSNFVERKKKNKTELQKMLNLPVNENTFTVGIVSRLTDQKGFDLIAEALDRLCEGGMQIILLGTGEEKYENLFRHYAWKYPDKVSANIYFSNEMSHKIYAGCDAFLMPSLFEPCGLSQLIAMRYGTLPIVRETGGLKDTVIPYNEYTGEGTGFSFRNFNANDMVYVLKYAMQVYYDNKPVWEKLVSQAMSADYSWGISADKYIKMYSEITGIELNKPEAKNIPEEKPTEEKIIEEKPEVKENAQEKAKEKPAKKKTEKNTEKETKKEKPKTAPKEKTEEKPKKKTVKKTEKTKAEDSEEKKTSKQVTLTDIEDKKESAKKSTAKTQKKNTEVPEEKQSKAEEKTVVKPETAKKNSGK
ncbi:MAG: glycogen synthase GlgA [Clostridia bacterium]|nr:glycogen synthase GlgA [Clostridia bacterium]